MKTVFLLFILFVIISLKSFAQQSASKIVNTENTTKTPIRIYHIDELKSYETNNDAIQQSSVKKISNYFHIREKNRNNEKKKTEATKPKEQ